MEEMINHFQPIITKLEDDHNEDFCGQTRVKIRPLSSSPSIAQAASSWPKRSSGSQTQAILEAIQIQAAQPFFSPIAASFVRAIWFVSNFRRRESVIKI